MTQSLLAVLTLLTLGFPATAALAEEPALIFSTFALDALPLQPPSAAEAAEFLSEGDWRKASPLATRGAWNERPSQAPADRWVSLTTVGFSEQADAYAFQFNGPGGAMSLAAHLPFGQTPVPGGMAWRWPFETMLGALQVAAESPERDQHRRPLRLQVKQLAADQPDAAPGKGGFSLNEARTLAPEQVFPGVEVIVHAAAFEAGWAPTSGPAEATAVCEVRVLDQACSFRLVLRDGDVEQVVQKDRIPWEDYHDYLVRMFRFAGSSDVTDFTRLDRGELELAAVQEGRLAYLANRELHVRDLQSRQPVWTTEPARKLATYNPLDQYAAVDSDGSSRLIRYRGSMAELDWEDGKATLLKATGAPAWDQLAVSRPAIAVVEGNAVRYYRQGELVWEQEESAPATAGPLATDAAVVYGLSDGRLLARSAADGRLLWESTSADQPLGAIVAGPANWFVFSAGAETLLAIDPATGEEQWRCKLGDALLQPPALVGSQLLVAVKSNRLLLLDTGSGQIVSQTDWPTWLIAVQPLEVAGKRQVACSDLSGKITLLSLPELQPQRVINLVSQPVGPLLPVASLRYRWEQAAASEEDNLLAEIQGADAPAGPVLLVTDVDGFLSILPLVAP
ncbi:outer membrane protein assembly factor BamB family protein [Lignipirellula cremea]|nr:PQQ-binding-like beta-propeller repeat protein [Lignipirellula cremea]